MNKTTDLDRNYPYSYLFLGHAYAAQGKYTEAVAAYTQAIAFGLDTPATQIFLGAASVHAGDRARALAILQQLQSSKAHVSAAELAILLTALGERERAFASLEQAYRAHDIQLQYLGVEPGLDPLRSDPRFADLVRRVGVRLWTMGVERRRLPRPPLRTGLRRTRMLMARLGPAATCRGRWLGSPPRQLDGHRPG